MKNEGPIIVKQAPSRLNLEQAQAFLRELAPLLKTDQPRVVLDFSQVCQVDSAGVDMLLKCLQEVMKHDGDLKLAAVPPESAIVLELARVDRLFEIFESASDAVESFHVFPVRAWQKSSGLEYPQPEAAPEQQDLEAAS